MTIFSPPPPPTFLLQPNYKVKCITYRHIDTATVSHIFKLILLSSIIISVQVLAECSVQVQMKA